MDDLDEVDKETLESFFSSTDNRFPNNDSDQAEVVSTLIDIDSEPDFTVADKIIRSRAILTLPDILYIKNEGSSSLKSVFAKKEIPSKTRFGPVDAPLTTKELLNPQHFLLKIKTSHVNTGSLHYDLSNENFCNWLMLVKPAITFAEQNLCAHIVGNTIYFTSIRIIPANEELKVWYTASYAKFIGFNVLHQPKLMDSPNLLDTKNLNIAEVPTQVNAKSRRQKMALQMKIYLETVNERKERSVPPKKRGWRQSSKDIAMIDEEEKSKKPMETHETNTEVSDVSFEAPKPDIKNSKNECQTCGKYFKRQDKLKQHLLVHTDERNFLCHKCGKTYRRKDKLNQHIKTAFCHQKLNFKEKIEPKPTRQHFPFKCKFCNVGFLRRGMYLNHVIKRHPDVKIDSLQELTVPILKQVRDFLCPHCEKVYKSAPKRKEHILKKHPGMSVPPGIRSILRDKASTNNNEINQQASIESGQLIEVKPIKCPFCERQYSCRGKMKSHVQDKHSHLTLPDSTTVAEICNDLTPLESDTVLNTSNTFNTCTETSTQNSTMSYTFPTPDTSLNATNSDINKESSNIQKVFTPQSKLKLSTSTSSSPHLLTQAMPKLSPTFYNVTQIPQISVPIYTHPAKVNHHHVHPRKQMLQALDQERHIQKINQQYYSQTSQHYQTQSTKPYMQSDFTEIDIHRESPIQIQSNVLHERSIGYTEMSSDFSNLPSTNVVVSSTQDSETNKSTIMQEDASHTQLIQAILENDTNIVQIQETHAASNHHPEEPAHWF